MSGRQKHLKARHHSTPYFGSDAVDDRCIVIELSVSRDARTPKPRANHPPLSPSFTRKLTRPSSRLMATVAAKPRVLVTRSFFPHIISKLEQQ